MWITLKKPEIPLSFNPLTASTPVEIAVEQIVDNCGQVLDFAKKVELSTIYPIVIHWLFNNLSTNSITETRSKSIISQALPRASLTF